MSTSLEQELNVLEDLINHPKRPFALLVGGDRIEKKLRIIHNMLNKVDKVLVGGLVACAFYRAKGHMVRDVNISTENEMMAKRVLEAAQTANVPIIPAKDAFALPTGLMHQRLKYEHSKHRHAELVQTQSQTSDVIAPEKKKGTKIDLHSSFPPRPGRTTQGHDERLYQQEKEEEEQEASQKPIIELAEEAEQVIKLCSPQDIPPGFMPVDLGEQAVQEFCEELRGCNTVLWIGLLGACEIADYAEGTKQVMNYLANLCAGGTTAIVCGGHTVSMVEKAEYGRCFSRVARVYDGTLAQMLEGHKPQGDTIRVHSF